MAPPSKQLRLDEASNELGNPSTPPPREQVQAEEEQDVNPVEQIEEPPPAPQLQQQPQPQQRPRPRRQYQPEPGPSRPRRWAAQKVPGTYKTSSTYAKRRKPRPSVLTEAEKSQMARDYEEAFKVVIVECKMGVAKHAAQRLRQREGPEAGPHRITTGDIQAGMQDNEEAMRQLLMNFFLKYFYHVPEGEQEHDVSVWQKKFFEKGD